MQSFATAPSSSSASSFAGLMEEIAAPGKKFPPARDLDELEDDIATLSYEHALRAHARYRPAAPPSVMSDEEAPGSLRIVEVQPGSWPTAGRGEGHPCAKPEGTERKLRKTSITVRFNQGESEQLRQRATEAGMTISAYLRSCAFEVEGLRTQVKQTVAEMRRTQDCSAPEGRRRRVWWWSRKRG